MGRGERLVMVRGERLVMGCGERLVMGCGERPVCCVIISLQFTHATTLARRSYVVDVDAQVLGDEQTLFDVVNLQQDRSVTRRC